MGSDSQTDSSLQPDSNRARAPATPLAESGVRHAALKGECRCWQPFPLRRWAILVLTLCALITVVFAGNVFLSRQTVPVWYWLLFQVGTALLLAVIGFYFAALWHGPRTKRPTSWHCRLIWLCLMASVICTSSLHGFFPFHPRVATVFPNLPSLKFIRYNYILTGVSLAFVVALAVLFFRGRPRLASIGLLSLAGFMLIPNDDCPNALNLPWIEWIGASPLMFLCNSIVLLVGFCALGGLWPRMSVLVMSGINAGLLVLGLGHTAQVDCEINLQAVEHSFERQRQRPPLGGLSLLPIEGWASFYVCSDAGLGFKEGLPVIIWIGGAYQQPETILNFVGRFREPVLMVWSDLLADLSADTAVENSVVWEGRRQEFATLLGRYRDILRFDPRRVYLTGTGFAGAYAWMLAYDRPDLYAGVVAISPVSYPQQIQQQLESGRSVVTVVVRGEKDVMFQRHLAQEQRTAQTIQSLNPHSRFLVKPGETRRDVARHWGDQLDCILTFTKPQKL